MKILFYYNKELIDMQKEDYVLEEHLKSKNNSYDYLKSEVKLYDDFLKILHENYKLLDSKLFNLFFYDREKYSLIYKVMIDDESNIEVKGIVYVDCMEEALEKNFFKMRELTFDVEKDFKTKIPGMEIYFEFISSNEVNSLIREYYPDNKIAQKLKNFNNKVLYAVNNSEYSEQFNIVKKQLDYEENWIKELSLIKEEELKSKYYKNKLINKFISNKFKSEDINLEMYSIKEYLEDFYNEGSDSLTYNHIISEIQDRVRNKDVLNLKDYEVEELRKEMESDKNTLRHFGESLTVLIVDDEFIDDENVVKQVKENIFDEFLDIDTHHREATRLTCEFVDDVEEIVSDLITGMFDRNGSGKSFYGDIKYEIIRDDQMELFELIEYTSLKRFSINIGNKSYHVFYYEMFI